MPLGASSGSGILFVENREQESYSARAAAAQASYLWKIGRSRGDLVGTPVTREYVAVAGSAPLEPVVVSAVVRIPGM